MTTERRHLVEGTLLVNGTSGISRATLIAVTVVACCRHADRRLRMPGETGTSVLVRLYPFIHSCIGVQIFWNGAAPPLAAVTALHPS